MNNLEKSLTGIVFLAGLSFFNDSCSFFSKTTEAENLPRKEVNLGDWKDLVKKAEFESNTLFMKDKDIIDILTEYTVIHSLIDPFLIPNQDTVPDKHKRYLFLNAYTNYKDHTIILNDYIDSLRSYQHRDYTAIKEMLRIFYYNEGIRNLSEKELDARAWLWYKRKYIDEVRKDAEASDSTKNHKIEDAPQK